MTLVHWDEVAGGQNLGEAAGAVRIGLQRLRIAPGRTVATRAAQSAEEELVVVLSGSGELRHGGIGTAIEAGDTIVSTPGVRAHALAAVTEPLDVLVFGTRSREAPDDAPAERAPSIVKLADVEGDFGGSWKRLGREGGASRSGLNLGVIPPDDEGAPPHCHDAEEELYVVLAGSGTLELWGGPQPGQPAPTEPEETHPLRPGHVVSRRPGTRIAHCLRSGPDGMTYLAYGTREPNDVCYYPRSQKIFWRGLGLIARLEALDYFDGEPT